MPDQSGIRHQVDSRLFPGSHALRPVRPRPEDRPGFGSHAERGNQGSGVGWVEGQSH